MSGAPLTLADRVKRVIGDELGIDIDDSAAEAVKTVGQLIALAERLAAGEREIAA